MLKQPSSGVSGPSVPDCWDSPFFDSSLATKGIQCQKEATFSGAKRAEVAAR